MASSTERSQARRKRLRDRAPEGPDPRDLLIVHLQAEVAWLRSRVGVLEAAALGLQRSMQQQATKGNGDATACNGDENGLVAALPAALVPTRTLGSRSLSHLPDKTKETGSEDQDLNGESARESGQTREGPSEAPEAQRVGNGHATGVVRVAPRPLCTKHFFSSGVCVHCSASQEAV